MEIKHLNDN